MNHTGTPTNEAVSDSSGYVKKNPSKYSFVSDGSMQVAGVTASCFKSDDVEGSRIKYCFSPEGVILYMKTDFQGSYAGTPIEMEMRATSYTTQVSDADFTPPATP